MNCRARLPGLALFFQMALIGTGKAADDEVGGEQLTGRVVLQLDGEPVRDVPSAVHRPRGQSLRDDIGSGRFLFTYTECRHRDRPRQVASRPFRSRTGLSQSVQSIDDDSVRPAPTWDSASYRVQRSGASGAQPGARRIGSRHLAGRLERSRRSRNTGCRRGVHLPSANRSFLGQWQSGCTGRFIWQATSGFAVARQQGHGSSHKTAVRRHHQWSCHRHPEEFSS